MSYSTKMNTSQAATHLGIAPRTLERWRCEGQGPRFLKVGRKVLYRQEDLDRFLAASMRCSTAEPAAVEND